MSRSEPLSAGSRGGGRGGRMVDADKPEVIMGPGDDSLHRHLLKPLGEPRARTSPAQAGEGAPMALKRRMMNQFIS